MIAIRIIYKLIRLMESNTSTTQLALTSVFGMLMGFSNPATLQWWGCVIALVLLNLNLPLLLFSYALWSSVVLVSASGLDRLGFYLLNSQRLLPLWTKIYHLPLLPYSRFYETSVLGELFVALTLCVPVYFLSRMIIEWSRPIVYHTWRMTKLYRLYVFYKPYTR